MSNLFDQPSRSFKSFFSKILEKIKIKFDRANFYKFLKYASYAFGFILLLLSISMAKVPFKLKDAYNESFAGKNNLEAAVYFASSEDYHSASKFSIEAQDNFSRADEILSDISHNFFIFKINFLKSQMDDALNIVKASRNISSFINEGTNLAQDLENLLEGDKKLSFSKFTIEEKKRMLKFINDSSVSFEKIKDDLKKASENLKNLEFRGLLSSFKDEVENLRIKVEESKELIVKALPMLKIMPGLMGYPEKMNYLIALQNNDELRPTGGFLGTFSVMKLEYGEIADCITHDIYHLDMPAQDVLNIEPPAPLKKYLGINKWYMRDSNWSPDWPASAKKIEWFYKNEVSFNNAKSNEKGKATFALNKNSPRVLGDFIQQKGMDEIYGVIAITPEVITDLLSITGPVYAEGIEYNKDNFVDILQYRVEKGYIQLGIPSWQRKEVISEIYKEIKIKLFDLPLEKLREVIFRIDENLKEKNILISLKDETAQSLIKEEGYGGEIKETQGDYFMVVDSNMASFKTDGVMDKKIYYNLKEENGRMISKLRVDYSNNGQLSWKTTRYRTYTRVYVPKGSVLIKMDGAQGEAEVYEEFGKTYFASFISVEPGKTGSLYFEYELPFSVTDADKYELYIQKQPGNNIRDLFVILDFDDEIKNYVQSDQNGFSYATRVEWAGDLKEDRKFKVEF
ncbi:MAG: DUF4012 domain-containing protein [bacterium]